MPKLPRVSGKETVRRLKRLGFELFDQTGSHVYMHKWTTDRWSNRVTIPVHGGKMLKLKTLKSILAQAEISIEHFVET